LRALRTDLQHDPTTMHIAPTPPFEGDPTLRWLTRTVRKRGPHVQLTSTLAYSPALRTTLVSEEGPPCEERPESKEEKRAHPWALTTMPGRANQSVALMAVPSPIDGSFGVCDASDEVPIPCRVSLSPSSVRLFCSSSYMPISGGTRCYPAIHSEQYVG
jgi:hypothetical protein